MQEVVYWNKFSDYAKGWLVINKLVNGVCGGGTFMHSDATLEEVQLLAETMTKKNSLNLIPFGGAKAGIRFDPRHPNAEEILKEFLKFCKSYLSTSWSTGADLNTDSKKIEEIIRSLGIKSGFYTMGKMYSKKLNISNQCEKIRDRVSLPVDEYFTLEKAVIGYSNAAIIKQFYTGIPFNIAVQGFGNVGTSIAYYMEKMGVAKITSIIDETGALLAEDGLSIKALIKLRNDNSQFKTLKELYRPYGLKHKCTFHSANFAQDTNILANFMHDIRVDIVAFCANRFAIDAHLIDVLGRYTFSESKYKFLVFGANLPFSSQSLMEYATAKNIKFLPCWLTSAGNSLLYANALSYEKIDSDWQNQILDNIADHLVKKSTTLWNYPLNLQYLI